VWSIISDLLTADPMKGPMLEHIIGYSYLIQGEEYSLSCSRESLPKPQDPSIMAVMSHIGMKHRRAVNI
jgi:hypothetical protein